MNVRTLLITAGVVTVVAVGGHFGAGVLANQVATNIIEEWRGNLPEDVKIDYASIEGDPYSLGATISVFSFSSDEISGTAESVTLSGFETSDDGKLSKIGNALINDVSIRFEELDGRVKIGSLAAENLEATDLEALFNGQITLENLQSLQSGPVSVDQIIVEPEDLNPVTIASMTIDEIKDGRVNEFLLNEVDFEIRPAEQLHIGNIKAAGIGVDSYYQSIMTGIDEIKNGSAPSYKEIYTNFAKDRPSTVAMSDFKVDLGDNLFVIDKIHSGTVGDDPQNYAYDFATLGIALEGNIVQEILTETTGGNVPQALNDIEKLELNVNGDGYYRLNSQESGISLVTDLVDMISAGFDVKGTALEYSDPELTNYEFTAPDGTPASISAASLSIEDQKLARIVLDQVAQSMGLDRAGLAAQFGYLVRLPLAGNVTPRISDAIKAFQAFIEEPSKVTINVAPQEPLLIKELFEALAAQPNIGELAEQLNVTITAN